MLTSQTSPNEVGDATDAIEVLLGRWVRVKLAGLFVLGSGLGFRFHGIGLAA